MIKTLRKTKTEQRSSEDKSEIKFDFAGGQEPLTDFFKIVYMNKYMKIDIFTGFFLFKNFFPPPLGWGSNNNRLTE